MSRIYDALRKSGKQLEEQTFGRLDAIIETMESNRGFREVPVARARIGPDTRIVVYSDPHSLGAERFQLLRTRLGNWQAAKKIKSLLVTSPLAKDGKSLTCINLATALAGQEERKVLLLEGDLRQPSLCSLLGLTVWPGLNQCFENGSDPFAAVRRVEPLNFYLLPVGQPLPNPVELLQSRRFSELIRDLSSHFDWVLIDSPPVSPLADTPVLRTQTDATLLVVKAGITPGESVEEAVEILGLDHVIGVVLNGAEGLDRSYYGYGSPKRLR